MHYIRRAALRAVSAQPSTLAARTYVTRTPFAVRAQCQTSLFQKRFASNDTAFPTDATTTGETVPPESSEADKNNESPAESQSPYETVKEEPSIEEQRETMREESITKPRNERNTTDSVQERASNMVDGVKSQASRVANATTDAARSAFGRSSHHDSARERSPDKASPSKILYVGNLFFDLKASQLEKQFKPFGNIIHCKIASDADGRSKGFGYVEFDNLDSAAAAIQSLDQQIFEGRRMLVQYHIRRQPRNTVGAQPMNPPSKTLFVGNLSFQMTDKDLSDLFRDCKNVLDIRVAIDRRSGQPRGFAHADFISIEDAEKGKAVLEKKQIYGRYLKLDFGRPSSPTPYESRSDNRDGSREDRPQRYNSEDRAQRYNREDRPQRYNREDRPQRYNRGDSGDRPQRYNRSDRDQF